MPTRSWFGRSFRPTAPGSPQPPAWATPLAGALLLSAQQAVEAFGAGSPQRWEGTRRSWSSRASSANGPAQAHRVRRADPLAALGYERF